VTQTTKLQKCYNAKKYYKTKGQKNKLQVSGKYNKMNLRKGLGNYIYELEMFGKRHCVSIPHSDFLLASINTELKTKSACASNLEMSTNRFSAHAIMEMAFINRRSFAESVELT